MLRLLIDTNVLVASAYNSGSASRKIVNGVRVGTFCFILSEDILREYERVLPKAVRSDAARTQLWDLIRHAERVTATDTPAVTADRSDDKFLAAALAAEADAIITSDQHLLVVHPYHGIEILQPVAFWRRFQDQDH